MSPKVLPVKFSKGCPTYTLNRFFTGLVTTKYNYLQSSYWGLLQDLKSENILVEPRGICKISDFGISKKVLDTDRGRLYSTMKGTVAYMAPEMIDNKNKGYDSKIDIWSVGCIVFEMWTGTRPWSGRKDVQILMKVSLALRPSMIICLHLSSFAQKNSLLHFHPIFRCQRQQKVLDKNLSTCMINPFNPQQRTKHKIVTQRNVHRLSISYNMHT